MLFDKRKISSCVLLRSINDPFNADKWKDKEMYYPVASMTGIDMTDLVKDSIVTIDMDGMGGAEKNLMLRCQVIDPKLELCRPGIALVSHIFS
jgi:hypothetical protein